MIKRITFIFSAMILLSTHVQASLTVDRTRVIYDMEKPGVSVVVENTDTKDPFLLQTWIESSQGEKITEPLVALPLLQRIEPGQKKQIRINSVNQTAQLPQDRETLFYFNVLGIPPKSRLENVVEVVIQSRFKLFYRPKGLVKYPDYDWQKKLTLAREGNSLVLTNPTPYHVVIININDSMQKVKDFPEIIIKPLSNVRYPLTAQQKTASEMVLTYMDDYGTPNVLKYTCNGMTCSLKSQP